MPWKAEQIDDEIAELRRQEVEVARAPAVAICGGWPSFHMFPLKILVVNPPSGAMRKVDVAWLSR